MAEMEDAPDLKSGDLMGHVGSTPTAATTVPAERGGIQRFVLLQLCQLGGRPHSNPHINYD